jgi:glycosyltransferase involved in cell wall biosynthesis
MTIPKIIHQLWIGNKPRPSKMMDTWKTKHPEFEYISWSEEEIYKRNFKLQCSEQIVFIKEINGKADIIRWEILYHYGGVFLDADSICIEPLDNHLMEKKAFCAYENEHCRPNLVATGTMAFPPKHPLCLAAIQWILDKNNLQSIINNPAWTTVGPQLLTNLLPNFEDVTVFPSFYFIPIHYSGIRYNGHGKVYAYQEWGSTKQNYDVMNSITLPDILQTPIESISILICSYNTDVSYVKECIESIANQEGDFAIELVWINDGSTNESSNHLELLLQSFQSLTRFCSVKYIKNPHNEGVGACLHNGLLLCSHEIVIRMDSDDIMLPTRILTQLKFMKKTSDCVLCGSNISLFKTENNSKIHVYDTHHPLTLTWNQYKDTKSHWFINHPTWCFKKSAIINVGNYNKTRSKCEDFELVLKVLKVYGIIYNIGDNLLFYRVHPNQVTYDQSDTNTNINLRNEYIDKMIQSDTVENVRQLTLFDSSKK